MAWPDPSTARSSIIHWLRPAVVVLPLTFMAMLLDQDQAQETAQKIKTFVDTL